jgi:hypothetical protein
MGGLFLSIYIYYSQEIILASRLAPVRRAASPADQRSMEQSQRQATTVEVLMKLDLSLAKTVAAAELAGCGKRIFNVENVELQ